MEMHIMPQRVLRMELLKQPTVWAAHLWNVSKGPLAEGDPEVCDAAFGIPTDVIEEFFLRELSSEELWPVFRIPLHSGFFVEVEYANEPEDHQILYQVRHDDWACAVCVGKSGGSWQLPALRWTELLKVSNAARQKDTHLEVLVLLLFFPAVWLTKEDNLDDVRRKLLDAWKRLNMMPQSQAAILVERLSDSCQGSVLWHRNEQLGWINDGDNSRRNPKSAVCLSNQEFHDLLAFMKAIGD
jgi:hypothetical protein